MTDIEDFALDQEGYVTMRNADGTQYLVVHEGIKPRDLHNWSHVKSDASTLTHLQFMDFENIIEEAREHGYYDGDYGVYQLTFHPL